MTFEIRSMKLNLIPAEKLLAQKLTLERKSESFVSSAKCSIYWVKY